MMAACTSYSSSPHFEVSKKSEGFDQDDWDETYQNLDLDYESDEGSQGDVFEKNKWAEIDTDYSYSVLCPREILTKMFQSMLEVNSILQLPPTTVRVLMHHFHWDKQKLLDSFYENFDDEEFFRKTRLVHPKLLDWQNNFDSKTEITNDDSCQICFLSESESSMSHWGMKCGHHFCIDCWLCYLNTKIVDQCESIAIKCPGYDCLFLLDDDRVMTFLQDDPKVKLKYQQLITNSFVQCDRKMRWCPALDCPNALRMENIDWHHPVTCSCGHKFCFQCGQNVHDPVDCQRLRKWLKKCEDDSETCNWMTANTKDCPKCQVPIEKNGGCNHMSCNNQTCLHQFCWLCMDPWDTHSDEKCAQFNETQNKVERENSIEKSRIALERYLFYYNRYLNHMNSLKLEKQLFEAAHQIMSQLQVDLRMTWIDTQFLNEAVQVLCECREMLMFTYVFGYFLSKTNQSIIFEENQKDLAAATEKLSEYLERDLEHEDVIFEVDLKQKVQDLYKYCQMRRQVVLEHVHEGYDKNWWDDIQD